MAIFAPVAIGRATAPQDASALLEEAELQREAATEARRLLIDREIQRSVGHPWAAKYYEGDGLGANVAISIAPKAGVAATLHGCLGLYDANTGAVVPQPDGSLRLDYEQPRERPFGGFPDRVVPVHWGERRYLINPREMEDFVAAVHSGREPRESAGGSFLLAAGDERKTVAGLPALQGSALALIRMQPVHARIVEVGAPRRDRRVGGMCNARYPVRIAVERNEALRIGERLLEASSRSPLIDIVVEESGRGRASAIAEVFEVRCGKPDADELPDTDWRLTTGAYDEVAANRRIADAARM